MYESFYLQAHREYPPLPRDWSDRSDDGSLNNGSGAKIKAARNGE